MAASRMNTVELGLLALILSALVYFLTYDNICPHEKGPFLGLPLKTPNSKLHVLVTGGAGYIGSHAAQRMLKDGHSVTVVDNLSRGNLGAVNVLKSLADPGRFQFVNLDLGNGHALKQMFRQCHFDLVMHFAAVAYVGESMKEPLRYYHNITANVVNVMEAMQVSRTRKLVFSSTCAVYGNPEKLPVTEETPPKPINPYGEAKLMSERVIQDYMHAYPSFSAVIFRYFNVYGSDPQALLGEWPRPELRQHSRISGACLDAAMHEIEALTITGTHHPTRDGTSIRDFIHVTDLVDAHVRGVSHLANPPEIYNIGTGRGVSVREFVDACRAVTGEHITVREQAEARPGDYAEVWADPTKIQNAMGWHAQFTDVEVSLRHAWAWRQRHPHGYR